LLRHADALDQVDDVIHPDLIGHLDGHQVARLLDAPAQGLGPGAAHVAEVAEALLAEIGALPDTEGTIDHDRRGSQPLLHRRGIDQRLDRRARLALRLRGVVERMETRIEPALHREDAAGARLLDHHATRDPRHRAQ
jgi:hypothetical protein